MIRAPEASKISYNWAGVVQYQASDALAPGLRHFSQTPPQGVVYL